MRQAPNALNERGQASLEYLLIGLVLLAMMGALAALWHFFSSENMSDLIEKNASHALNSFGGLCDVFLF